MKPRPEKMEEEVIIRTDNSKYITGSRYNPYSIGSNSNKIYRHGFNDCWETFNTYHQEVLKRPECIDDEYQCEHVGQDVIDGNCIWCELTVLIKGLKKQKELRLELREELDWWHELAHREIHGKDIHSLPDYIKDLQKKAEVLSQETERVVMETWKKAHEQYKFDLEMEKERVLSRLSVEEIVEIMKLNTPVDNCGIYTFDTEKDMYLTAEAIHDRIGEADDK